MLPAAKSTTLPATVSDRIAALKAQAQAQPLTWNPKKGDYLVGAIKAFGFESNRFTHIIIEDDKRILHRVSVCPDRQQKLQDGKARNGDLISIQFLGREKNYQGRNVEVFNIVVDKAEVI